MEDPCSNWSCAHTVPHLFGNRYVQGLAGSSMGICSWGRATVGDLLLYVAIYGWHYVCVSALW